ncbi:MAG TPA: tRNA (guanosine(46)-N7)-methyltransferase TrmB, partial [Gemmataceae bacterium]
MRKPRRLPAEELAPYCWECPKGKQPSPLPKLLWESLFGNDRPVEIEVGMGKGLFLLTEAMSRPNVNFFGIEIVRKYQLYAATRYAIRKLPNVKTCCGDAGAILRESVLPASVQAVHVLFPDPWWKARHKKRRVFTAEFAASVERALAPGGLLHFASDVEEYFSVMKGIIDALPAFQEELNAPVDAGFRTNFERKA